MTRHHRLQDDTDVEHAIGAESIDELDEGEHRRRELQRVGAVDREALLRSLADADWRVRRFAARLAGDSHETVNAEELVGFLDSEDVGVRNAAMKALIRMGTRALDDLHAALRHEHADVRNFSAVCIGNIGHCSSAPVLIEALEHEGDANVRYMIVEALGRVGDVRACETLTELVEGHEHVAAAAVTALGDIGSLSSVEHLVPLLSDPYLGGLVADALCRLADGRALPALVRQAVTVKGGSTLFIGAIARTLDEIERHAPELVGAMREVVDVEDRCTLADLLVPSLLSADVAEMTASLRVAFWLSDTRLASPVLVAYGHLGTVCCPLELRPDTEFARALLQQVKQGGIPQGRIAVLETLSEHPQVGTADLLLDLLDDSVPGVVVAALRALIAAGEPVPADRLARMWDSPIDDVRYEAARALGCLCSSGVARILDEAAHSSDDARVRCAAIALAASQSPIRGKTLQGVVDLLAENPDAAVRRDIARAMIGGAAGFESRKVLLGLSQDESPTVRRVAASSMRGTDRPEQRERLRELAADPYPDVRRAAISGLGGIHADRQDVEVITAAIEDPDPRVAIAATESIGRCQRLLSAPHILIERVSSDDIDVAVEATRSLSRLDPLLAATTAKKRWDTTLPWRMRAALIHALSGESSDHALSCASSALEDPDPNVRSVAVEILASRRDNDGAMLLLTLLGDADLRSAALEVLLEYGSVVVGPLTQVLNAAGGLSCIDGAWLLGHTQGARTEETLRGLLTDSKAELRWRGLIALMCHPSAGLESELENIATSDPDVTCASLARVICGSVKETQQ